MNRPQEPHEQDLDLPEVRTLSSAELDAVQAGVGALVHETVHAGTVTVPRTGGAGTGLAPRRPGPSTRSPPTSGA